MSSALTLKNLDLSLLIKKFTAHSSDSLIGSVDKIKDEIITDELLLLKDDLGDDLFYALSDEDKRFILDTEGSVDFGYKLDESDLKRIFSSIKNDYQY